MKEIDPDARVLFSSGYNLDYPLDDLRAEGVVGFVHKPYDLDALAGAIDRHVRRRGTGAPADDRGDRPSDPGA